MSRGTYFSRPHLHRAKNILQCIWKLIIIAQLWLRDPVSQKVSVDFKAKLKNRAFCGTWLGNMWLETLSNVHRKTDSWWDAVYGNRGHVAMSDVLGVLVVRRGCKSPEWTFESALKLPILQTKDKWQKCDLRNATNRFTKCERWTIKRENWFLNGKSNLLNAQIYEIVGTDPALQEQLWHKCFNPNIYVAASDWQYFAIVFRCSTFIFKTIWQPIL